MSAPWLAHSVHSNKFQSDVVQQRWRKVLFFSSFSLKLVFAPDWWSDPAGAVFPFRFPGVVAFNPAEQRWQRIYFRANLVEIEEGKTVELCEHRGASVRYQPISRLLCLLWPVLHITAALGCSQNHHKAQLYPDAILVAWRPSLCEGAAGYALTLLVPGAGWSPESSLLEGLKLQIPSSPTCYSTVSSSYRRRQQGEVQHP